MIYNINNETYFPNSKRSDSSLNDRYFKFYQTKFRQSITEQRHKKQIEEKQNKKKTLNIFEQFSVQQKLAKIYLNKLREESQLQTDRSEPECSQESFQTIENFHKIVETPSRKNRVISAPSSSRRETNSENQMAKPIRRINSSKTVYKHQPDESLLNTVLNHLDAFKFNNYDKKTNYQQIQNKLYASLSPQVYRSFQRIPTSRD